MPGLQYRIKSLSDNYHPAWLIVGLATFLQITTNFIGQAFAILIVALRDEYAWTLTAITMAYFLRSIVSAVLAPAAGWIGDRYGARSSLMAATFVYMAGLFLMGTMTEIWHLYLYYSVMLGISQSMFRVNIPTTVAAWFKRKLGLAVGIQQSAGGMGTSIMAPLLAFVLVRTDWQTAFWIIAPVGGAMILALLWRFQGDPRDRGLTPYGTEAHELPPSASSTEPGMVKLRSKVFLRQAMHTRAFWNLILIHHLGCIGHSIVMVGVVFYATTRGVGLETAAFIISIYSLTSILSRFSTPVLADIWGAKGGNGPGLFYSGSNGGSASLDPRALAILPFCRPVRRGNGWRNVSLPGDQPAILWDGAGALHFRIPEHGSRLRHGDWRPVGRRNLRPDRRLPTGVDGVDCGQYCRGRLNPVPGADVQAPDAQLGGRPTGGSEVPTLSRRRCRGLTRPRR